jgi:hypothetical protein
MDKSGEREFVRKIKDRLEDMKNERRKREGDWTSVQELVAPSVLSFDSDDKIPQRPKRYTSRPTHYLKTLVSGLSGYSISPNIVWLKLSMEDHKFLDYYGVKDWMEVCEMVMYNEFNRSNLYQNVNKAIEFSAQYGHGVTLIDESSGRDRLRYTTYNIRDIFLDLNEYDEVETVYRRFTMTLRQAAEFFGEENLSQNRREDYKDERRRNHPIHLVHAVYRREFYDEDRPGKKDMPFASVYIEEDSDHLILEDGYLENPYAVFIWDPVVGTPYGESPAIYALDDIRLLNKTDEARLQVAQMSAFPAMNVPDEMRGHETVVPKGYNYYTNPANVMSPIQTGANFPITLEVTASIEDRVKDWFHVDFFLMLQHQGRGNMTATEVMELQGEKASVLSSLVVNLNDYLSRIVKRSFNLLLRQGKIPPLPPALEGTGAKLKIDFTGPLAQAQKKYHESSGIAQGLQLIGAMAQMNPEAMDVVDFDRLIKAGLEGAGIPQSAIREDKDIINLRNARAEQAAAAREQEAAMEQQKNILGNLNKLNEPIKPGSALTELGIGA